MRMDDVVELAGGDAGNHVRHQCVEDLGGEPAGAAHALEALGAVELDDAGAGFDPVFGGDGDIFGHGPKISDQRGRESRTGGWMQVRQSVWTAASGGDRR